VKWLGIVCGLAFVAAVVLLVRGLNYGSPAEVGGAVVALCASAFGISIVLYYREAL
jgi:hypothetical protein